ncbi:hypothetical protein KMT30_45340 [Streptomyces sp. IBSBF 2953]|jgi:hypothetical protein|uniref:hypothetical protein n=3 Tax=Bacteria TaxID=2 RepID=UPI00099C40E9|nr:hypothetical protein [Pseudomonas fluorescens]MCQ9186140.1 hypothetical protein [Streptomyces hayashii]MEA3172406.1 hypothetical protein [Pseudomonas sp.]MBC8783598.1 hypothetical protein [Pseudomonas fluorescens]NNB67688.1 hypothetical protein [Pseudomonas fluorescens]OPB16862.1 hypothetical protein BFW91_01905 [Pseudomonas fluorescens]
MARAAINVLGATGATYDFVTNGAGVVESSRESVGVYHITGCLGMVPFPPADDGWGYTVNQIDSRADVDIQFEEGVLTVTVTRDDKPYDLKHMITLHILVPDAPVVPMQPVEVPLSLEEPQPPVDDIDA